MKLSTILLATFAVAVDAKSRGSHDKESGVRRKLKSKSAKGGFSMKGFSFKPPEASEGDVRGPCPAINTLANHGFINRDGKNVNMRELLEALSLVYDVTESFLESPGKSAIDLGLAIEDPDAAADETDVFRKHKLLDISALGIHRASGGTFPGADGSNLQEHEASLVREDSYFCENGDAFPMTSADPGLICLLVGCEDPAVPAVNANPTVTVGPTNVNDGDTSLSPKTFLDIEDIKLFQRNRILDSSLHNDEDPLNFQFSEDPTVAKGGISAQKVLIMIFGQDEVLGRVDKEKLRVWLGEERLPDGYAPTNLKHDPSVADTLANQVREKFRADLVSYFIEAEGADGTSPNLAVDILECTSDATLNKCMALPDSRQCTTPGAIFDEA